MPVTILFIGVLDPSLMSSSSEQEEKRTECADWSKSQLVSRKRRKKIGHLFRFSFKGI